MIFRDLFYCSKSSKLNNKFRYKVDFYINVRCVRPFNFLFQMKGATSFFFIFISFYFDCILLVGNKEIHIELSVFILVVIWLRFSRIFTYNCGKYYVIATFVYLLSLKRSTLPSLIACRHVFASFTKKIFMDILSSS